MSLYERIKDGEVYNLDLPSCMVTVRRDGEYILMHVEVNSVECLSYKWPISMLDSKREVDIIQLSRIAMQSVNYKTRGM